jgi:hypothetical protein
MRKCRRVAGGDPEYYVTDGATPAGTVRLVNGKYQALARDGSVFGVFDTLWAAVAALPEAAS